jgi:hypothetical protein
MTEPPAPLREAVTPFDEEAADELPPPADPAPAEQRALRGNGSARKGRHFGPRPVADPRTARFDVRCTPAFRDKVLADAQAAGLSLSAFVCARLGDTPGPRVHRNPSELIKAIAQLAAQMGKPGGLLNQGIRGVNRIALEAPAANSRDRLADLLQEALDLLRPAVAELRECLAAVMRLLGMRVEVTDGDRDY